jgi:hypothetical protein
MPAPRSTEALALHALIEGDEHEAKRILDEDMTAAERRTFTEQLNRLSILADDQVRCPGCDWPAEGLGTAMAQGRHWHRPCLAAARNGV